MKASLFLINSYISRLLVGILAICIISTGALVSLSNCKYPEGTGACNCTNYTIWRGAVLSPDPDDESCQFPQVTIVNDLKHQVYLPFSLSIST